MLFRLEEDRAQVKALAVQIADLERSLSALRAEKKLAEARLDSYKYPVLILPNEITSEIFTHFLPTYPVRPPLFGPLSPTVLTQICCRWRAIALATPTLWRAISFSGRKVGEVEQILLWLSRSGGCPLSIAIEDTPYPIPDVSPLLAALVPHCARWEQVEFHVPSVHASTLPEGPMPLLRHLHLSVTGPYSMITISEMPMLRSVVLHYFGATNVILPWTQLTSLTLIEIFPSEWVPILQQTPNLVHCKLEVIENSPGLQPDIQLLFLESLTLTVIDGLNGSLPCLIAPTLRRLETTEKFLGPSPIESLTSFISKCRCKLHEMRIIDHTLVLMKSYRQAFPSILKLSFGKLKDGEVEEEDEAMEEHEEDDEDDAQDCESSEVEGDSDSDS
ncbi:hypothetical protein DFH06DRAFT_1195559 [Mycena polygramma]|nr:hypothetical protein DFH06DRAFT_1195559 [Mycena polygramma]